jgi:hypothetical protein
MLARLDGSGQFLNKTRAPESQHQRRERTEAGGKTVYAAEVKTLPPACLCTNGYTATFPSRPCSEEDHWAIQETLNTCQPSSHAAVNLTGRVPSFCGHPATSPQYSVVRLNLQRPLCERDDRWTETPRDRKRLRMGVYDWAMASCVFRRLSTSQSACFISMLTSFLDHSVIHMLASRMYASFARETTLNSM